MDNIDKYLKETGQTDQQLFAGASQVGLSYIINDLIPKALAEKKIITWVDKDITLGTGEYQLKDR
jgi:putative ribosome biogenesis GTPase RsgA